MLLWVIKRRVCGFTSVSETERMRILDCVQIISWWRNEILSTFENVQVPIQLSASEDWKLFEEEYYLPDAKSPVEKLATCLR